jgi:hypothetical protein
MVRGWSTIPISLRPLFALRAVRGTTDILSVGLLIVTWERR